MIAAVDTNIFLDILLPDPDYQGSSYGLLTKYMKTALLIISEVVYSELASQFDERSILNDFIHDMNIKIIASSPDALWAAAKAWKKYTGLQDKTIQCSQCGRKKIFRCDTCNSIITCRQHIIPDFLIAGHALVHSDKLLTRDRGFYKTYFNELETESGL
jgi:hypothetical protein